MDDNDSGEVEVEGDGDVVLDPPPSGARTLLAPKCRWHGICLLMVYTGSS